MPEIPRMSGDEAIKVFIILGFQQVRHKGSHVVMRREEKGCVVPRHKELAVGTLRPIKNRPKKTPINRCTGLRRSIGSGLEDVKIVFQAKFSTLIWGHNKN